MGSGTRFRTMCDYCDGPCTNYDGMCSTCKKNRKCAFRGCTEIVDSIYLKIKYCVPHRAEVKRRDERISRTNGAIA